MEVQDKTGPGLAAFLPMRARIAVTKNGPPELGAEQFILEIIPLGHPEYLLQAWLTSEREPLHTDQETFSGPAGFTIGLVGETDPQVAGADNQVSFLG